MSKTNQDKLYAMTGLFDTPDEIMAAASKASKKYRHYDVHTPYPVHGMDDAMGLGESGIGWVTISIGTTCMLLMLSFIAWVTTVDYPTIFAGKPYFNLPGYIPILFETTILTGSVSTVIILFTVFCGLPFNNHPLHDTPYMQRTSDDKFGLCIEAADEQFGSADDAKAFLESVGAKDIRPVHHDPNEASSGLSLMSPQFIAVAVLVVISVSAGGYFALNRMVFMAPYNWMSVQERTVPQIKSTVFKDGRSMQQPVEGTVARGFMPYAYAEDIEGASKYMSNPLPQNEEVFAMGKTKYEQVCSACHGYYGEGDSRLNPNEYPAGKTLHSKDVVNWSDARIYHIITQGQNVMPSYAKQLTREERWAIVHYVRALQRSLNPKETDTP